MKDLYQAEWRKASGNRCLVGCTIWIYPLMGLFILGLFIFVLVFNANFRGDYVTNPPSWAQYALLAWVFPSDPTGLFRLPLLGFAAAVFASEYQHHTWKNIAPPNYRWQLLLSKILAICGYIMFALGLMMLVLVIGFGIISVAVGADYPPALTPTTIVDSGGEVLIYALVTLALLLLFTSLAAMIAMLTRSVIGTVVGVIFVSLTESLGILFPVAIGREVINFEDSSYLQLITPTHNANNILFYVTNHELMDVYGNTVSVVGSIGILALWTVTFMALAIYLFQQQDIQ